MTLIAAAIRRRSFGRLSDGRAVTAWVLTGAGGMILEVLDYGGIVTRLQVLDRGGRLADVVLGFDRLGAYIANQHYVGAIIGRVAGRLTGAAFTLDGEQYLLAANDSPNHVHGGVDGFDRKIWSAKPGEDADGSPSLRLTHHSPHGDEGYPGNVSVAVTYTVTSDNTLRIDTHATTDRPTPFGLTNHSYFNLGGEASGSTAGHTLRIIADEYVPTDERMALSGRLLPVTNANDFNTPRVLGDTLGGLFKQHGDLYRVRRSPGEASALVTAAVLSDPISGRTMTVRTTEPYVQLYTGVGLNASLVGKSGAPYVPFAGLCLECEAYPDAANTPALGDLLRPGTPFRQTTVYAFSAA